MKLSEKNHINECIVVLQNKHNAKVQRKLRNLVSGPTMYLIVKGEIDNRYMVHRSSHGAMETIKSFFPESRITSGSWRLDSYKITVVLLPNKS